MKIFAKSRILASILVVTFCLPLMTMVAFAGNGGGAGSTDDTGIHSTLLPAAENLTVEECEKMMRWVNANTTVKVNNPDIQPGTEGASVITTPVKDAIAKRENEIEMAVFEYQTVGYKDVLGCAIKTGDVKMWMIPFFIRYILEFIIGIAGLLAVGGIVYGGYLYLFAGLSDDKDKGKNAIKNGLIGLVLVLTSWAIVNIVISLVTM